MLWKSYDGVKSNFKELEVSLKKLTFALLVFAYLNSQQIVHSGYNDVYCGVVASLGSQVILEVYKRRVLEPESVNSHNSKKANVQQINSGFQE